MARNENSKSTKELILDAAFSFLKKTRYTSFSMNELAEKVGITKPAIYRHFKNKESVLEAMENRVVEGMLPILKGLGPCAESAGTRKSSLVLLVQHLIENPTHINYLIAQMSSTPNYEKHIYKRLYENDISFSVEDGWDVYLKRFSTDLSLFSRHVYSGMTIFFFVKLLEKLQYAGAIATVPKDYAEKIVDLMLNGLAGTTDEDDVFHPVELSQERKRELIELCKIDEEVFPKENWIFTALAAVIEKYKIPGVTVERIANELNMAKSSLYEYFENKNEMVKTLIFKELALLQTIAVENSIEAKNFTEYTYILLLSELEYFTHRPSVIPICGWLLMDGGDMPREDGDCSKDNDRSPWEKRLPDRVIKPDLGFAYSPEIITGWIRCLPIAFLVEAKGKNISQEKRMEGFMLMIDYILNGLDGGKK